MPLKFFVVALGQLEAGEDMLNAFLRSHRILAIDRRWVEAKFL